MKSSNINFQNDYTTCFYDDSNDSLKDTMGMNKQGSIYINDEKLNFDGNVRVISSGRYAEIPFIAVMDALGADLQWQNDELLSISYCSKEYILDITQNSLKEKDKNRNYIALPPGIEHGGCYVLSNGDFYIDTDSLSAFFKVIKVKLMIDFENSTVRISS